MNSPTRTSRNQTGLKNLQRIEEPNRKGIISWVFQSVGKIPGLRQGRLCFFCKEATLKRLKSR
jgi:hypothetical protein